MNPTPARPIEEPIAYYPGALDYAAVEEFLRLLNPKTEVDCVAQLAASVALNAKGASVADRVQSAIAIQAEAEKAVILRRDSILATMNFPTVQRLVEKLVSLDSASSEGEEREQGPYRSTLSAALEQLEQVKKEPPLKFDSEGIQGILEQADKRTKIPRPGVPCDLITALRYASGMNSTPSGALEKAFTDFLCIIRLEREMKVDSDEAARLQLEAFAKAPNRLGMKDLKILQQWRSWLEDRRKFLHDFAPGTKPPGNIARETNELVNSRWKSSDSVSLDSLAWLAADFHPFWKKHQLSYLQQHAKFVSVQKKTAKTKRDSGGRGVDNREYKRWVGFVQGWLQYADSSGRFPNKVVDTYVSEAKIKTEDARRKVAGFLRMLQEHVAKKSAVDDVVERLQETGMKSMNPRILQACAHMLNEHGMRPVDD